MTERILAEIARLEWRLARLFPNMLLRDCESMAISMVSEYPVEFFYD